MQVFIKTCFSSETAIPILWDPCGVYSRFSQACNALADQNIPMYRGIVAIATTVWKEMRT